LTEARWKTIRRCVSTTKRKAKENAMDLEFSANDERANTREAA